MKSTIRTTLGSLAIATVLLSSCAGRDDSCEVVRSYATAMKSAVSEPESALAQQTAMAVQQGKMTIPDKCKPQYGFSYRLTKSLYLHSLGSADLANVDEETRALVNLLRFLDRQTDELRGWEFSEVSDDQASETGAVDVSEGALSVLFAANSERKMMVLAKRDPGAMEVQGANNVGIEDIMYFSDEGGSPILGPALLSMAGRAFSRQSGGRASRADLAEDFRKLRLVEVP